MNDITEALRLLNEQPSIDLDALITQARTTLSLEQTPASNTSNEVTPTDPAIVNALLAQADLFKRAEDAAKRDRAKITDLLAELVGEDGVLVVNGAPVFTVSTVASRVLNQSHIKSLFPDIAENAEMWTETSTTRRVYR